MSDLISRRFVSDALLEKISKLNAEGEVKTAKELIRFKKLVDGMTAADRPTGELISRADAIDALGEEPDILNDTEEEWSCRNAWVEHISAIKALPSAETPTDIISRQDAIDAIRKQLNDTSAMVDVVGWQEVDPTAPIMLLLSAISVIPSAEKTGKWIDDDKHNHKYHRCSCCGLGRFNWGEDNFCPNCGADMRGDTE